MDIQKNVHQSLAASLFSNNDLILLGVSGGPDSIVMAHALYVLNWKIALGYFDHQLRPQSILEKAFVQQIAENYKIPFYCGKGDIAEIAKEEKKTIEEAAREERYRFLFSVAQEIGAHAVAVAHTADDQVETILMHLLRGSGTRGLVGMQSHSITAFHPTIPLLRPLLDVWRGEIEDYCRQYNLSPKQDNSNLDKTYVRNRIRHELIPEMQSYNAGFKNNLLRMRDIVKDDWEVLDQYYKNVFNGIVEHNKKGYLKFSSRDFKQFPPGSQKAVLYQCLIKMNQTDTEIENHTVQRLLDFVHQSKQKQHIELSAQIHTFRKGDNIFLTNTPFVPLERQYPHCDDVYSCDLSEPFHIHIGDENDLEGKFLTRHDYQPLISTDGFYWEAYVDAASIQNSTLQIREVRNGDRYMPLGMNGQSIKISDLFINKKIPAQVRKTWPVIVDGSRIIWIPGFAPSHICRVCDTTTDIFYLKLCIAT